MNLNVKTYGAGCPLLMIHGIISDSTFFEESAKLLQDDFFVITYDRKGYGKSVAEEGADFSIHAQAEDAAEILRQFCQEPAVIFGNSAGGLIAIDLAIHHPELIRSMVLMEPSLGYDEESIRSLSEWNGQLNQLVERRKIKSALPLFSNVIGGQSQKQNFSSLEAMRQTYKNLETFMYGELNEVQNHLPAIEECQSLTMPIAVAVTEQGIHSIFAQSSLNGAQRIGWPVVWLPGYHNVAKDLPEEFAHRFRSILGELEG